MTAAKYKGACYKPFGLASTVVCNKNQEYLMGIFLVGFFVSTASSMCYAGPRTGPFTSRNKSNSTAGARQIGRRLPLPAQFVIANA